MKSVCLFCKPGCLPKRTKAKECTSSSSTNHHTHLVTACHSACMARRLGVAYPYAVMHMCVGGRGIFLHYPNVSAEQLQPSCTSNAHCKRVLSVFYCCAPAQQVVEHFKLRVCSSALVVDQRQAASHVVHPVTGAPFLSQALSTKSVLILLPSQAHDAFG